MGTWTSVLHDDPQPWLLDEDDPAVRHLALRHLAGRSDSDPEVVAARTGAMAGDPIASILAAQHAEGWWSKPGAGYGPKYAGTVWQVIFLDQLGADANDPRVRAGCDYVLEHSQAPTGGFAATAEISPSAPPPSRVIHCLNGNLLRALIGLGWLDDRRVDRAIDWQVAAITGAGNVRWNSLVPGPGFLCGANDGRPCAWGATKVVLGLSRVPAERRSPELRRALDTGVAFLLSRDPAIADYPTPRRDSRPNGSWFRLGFPSGYVADVLQVLEALCDAGAAGDPRLEPAVAWLLARQDEHGRWANRYAYQGKLIRDIDRPGRPSKWVTLRACRVLKAISEAGGGRAPAS